MARAWHTHVFSCFFRFFWRDPFYVCDPCLFLFFPFFFGATHHASVPGRLLPRLLELHACEAALESRRSSRRNRQKANMANMANTWQEHGKTWHRHGMAKAWQRHSKHRATHCKNNMAKHGNNMTKHGKTTWQQHGQTTWQHMAKT